MRVLRARPLDDCFEGSSILELDFDRPLTDDDVRRFESLGALQYFTRFPRPLFIVHDPQRFTLKGLVGNATLRCVMHTTDVPGTVCWLAARLSTDTPSPAMEEQHAAPAHL